MSEQITELEYTRVVWQDGTTPLDDDNLNKMDEGIDNATKAVNAANENIKLIQDVVEEIDSSISGINNNIYTIKNDITNIKDDISDIVTEPDLSKTLSDAKNYTDEKINILKNNVDNDILGIITETNAINSKLSDHTKTPNPHGITKDTIGLSKVSNMSPDDLQNLFTAGNISSGQQGFVTGDMVHSAFGSHKLQWQDIT